ncbi:hypothetical protein MRBBS_0741 [Marinobacter sp. BSs20148]|nr:hypothetical protein MRBBS_0741 [Marinobacter sp. BSs20148]
MGGVLGAVINGGNMNGIADYIPSRIQAISNSDSGKLPVNSRFG